MKQKGNYHSQELDEINDKLAKSIASKNFETIEAETRFLNNNDGGINAGKLWKLKKKLCPKKTDPKTALVDEEGNLVTNDKGINDI